ncbi:MAG: DUF4419 domain-containing protein [Deltaproteobacteria bacterium]|nr:DUF4419 domain-containing protein [Deltaproteobacteria bacterium]
MIRFTVDEVTPAVDPLAEVDTAATITALAGGAIEAFGPTAWPLCAAFRTEPVQTPEGWREVATPYHPFVAAVHAAFDQHRPLELSPDAIWLCIAQGFASHVNANAERLRDRIVAHAGRVKLEVRRDDFRLGAPDNPWPEVFTALTAGVRAHAADLADVMTAAFSTTTPIARAASELAILDTTQAYFAFRVLSMCGFPSIALTGTVADWALILARAKALAAYDCAPWIAALTPVLEELVRTAQGQVDQAFWRSFYKLKGESGGPYVSGWINTLLPYVLDYHGNRCANRDATGWAESLGAPFGGGPNEGFLPSGLSQVPFLWITLFGEHRMRFIGGFVGVGQDRATLAVRPEIGWAVGRALDAT